MRRTAFELSRAGVSGRTIRDGEFDAQLPHSFLPQGWLRNTSLGLPELTEVEVVRHFSDLSRDNFGVDNGTYPLGSCTMKYNPKVNEAVAALSGFTNAHPLQPPETLSGLWEILFELQQFIAEIMGLDYVSLQPAAGANGELAGLLMIRKYFLSRGAEARKIVLVADAAHGTNPASAAMAGFSCRIIPTTAAGLMDLNVLRSELTPAVAAVMLTNPSTLGLFEEQIEEIAKIAHENGSLLYYDGANMNALMGIARPGDMGFDVAHINVHKTLSTPHSGGGPGAGPVGVKAFLKDFLPIPIIARGSDGKAMPTEDVPQSIGRIKGFYGHIEVLLKAYSYILAMGPEGLREASQNAVLNANYLQGQLADLIPAFFKKHCMHECLLDGSGLGISAYHFAKRLIDYGVHPPTLVGAGCVYFSEAMKSGMLIEPTETETKRELDHLISVFRRVVSEGREQALLVSEAPYSKAVAQIPASAAEIEEVK